MPQLCYKTWPKVVVGVALLLSLAYPLSTKEDSEESFIPKDISRAVAGGCGFFGMTDSPPYVEAKVFLKWDNSHKGWDYSPVYSRRTAEQGGVFKAIEDCREWLENAEKALKKAQKEQLKNGDH